MFDLSMKECFFRVKEIRGDRKILLKHVFRLPTLDDWFTYFRGASQLGLSKGRDVFELSNMMQERDEELWATLILRVEGYFVNKQPLMEFEDWKDKLPISHKLEAVSGFQFFWREDAPSEESLITEEVFDLGEDLIEMRFVALQNSEPCHVKFCLRAPDAKDYIRFNRVTSKMQLVRTKERNVSAIRIPQDIRPLVGIFDKLIEKVEGYVFEGADLMACSDWQSKIDAYQKKEVVRELFVASLEETEGKVSRE